MNRSRRYIVRGQRVDLEKIKLAQSLRDQMTEEEKQLWQHLRANQFDGIHFRRQQVIDGFVVDFYCHSVGLVVEVDGEIHQDQAAYDAERDAILKARGLEVLRITNDEVRTNLDGALESIRVHVKKR